MKRVITTSVSGSTDGRPAIVPVSGISSAAASHLANAVTTASVAAAPDGVPVTSIRHALRALASEGGALTPSGMKLLRPLVKQAHELLRERLEAGGSVEAYLRGRTRLADSAVMGLLHIASVSSRMRGSSMIAPLTAIAVSGYGRSELAPGSDLDLLFLLPDSSQSGDGAPAAATEACIKMVVAGLWDLGFVLDHAVRSSRECLDLACDEPAVLAGLLNRRFLWGGYSLFTALDADLAGLFSGPLALQWRHAVDRALASAPGATLSTAAMQKNEPDVNEPDVKQGPGGLCDLQRALSANTLASGRSAALVNPALVEAHRFLWSVRCHLHLLVGRAEDRLRSTLQHDVARRLGFDELRGATASHRLLHAFRHHARGVREAAALAAGSISVQPR